MADTGFGKRRIKLRMRIAKNKAKHIVIKKRLIMLRMNRYQSYLNIPDCFFR
jgi:hypothetical protein